MIDNEHTSIEAAAADFQVSVGIQSSVQFARKPQYGTRPFVPRSPTPNSQNMDTNTIGRSENCQQTKEV